MRLAGDGASVGRPSATKVFANYASRRRLLPDFFWDVARLGVLAGWIGVAAALFFAPQFGLRLLWTLIVPSVPALLVFAPGLWRQVCPMAFLNQSPKRLGFSLSRTLPGWLESRAYTVSVLIFIFVISLRQPFFNHVGWATGALLLASLAAALAGGFVFKGRSGWCGTFCPLGPIQRVYGQAPVLVVSQSYCNPCVGCQKNCYDQNPQAAVFDDIYDENPAFAGQRRLFYSILPGLILAYFQLQYDPAAGYPVYLAKLLAAALGSAGAYQVVTSVFSVNPYRSAIVFAAAALIMFYGYAGPLILQTSAWLLHFGTLSPTTITASQYVGSVAALALLVSGLTNERIYQRAWWAARAALTPARRTHWVTVEGLESPVSSGHDETLLKALATAGCGVEGQCGSGLCGSDAVEVLEGAENLSSVSAEEQATLARLGLGPAVRLACCCRVRGAVTVRSAKAAAPETTPAPVRTRLLLRRRGPVPLERMTMAVKPTVQAQPHRLDLGKLVGLRHVLIIGNGAAGETVAEELRRGSSSVAISIVSSEPIAFYNRISIGRIVEGRATPQDLVIRPDGWSGSQKINTQLGVSAESIDRARRQVLLSNGKRIDYDKIVIATGCRPRLPLPRFLSRSNAFVMQTAADASALRAWVEAGLGRRSLVAGGGVLAVETAEQLARAGLETTLICRSRHLMADTIDSESAAVLQRYLERLGVNVLIGVDVFEWRGRDAFRMAYLSNGDRIEADLFVACIGTIPNVEIGRDCGLAIGRGILVDETMATSDPDIYAVGDVAERSDRPSGLWSIATAQGRTAAASLLGAPVDYTPRRAYVKLKSPGMDLRAFGVLKEEPGDEVFVAPPFEAAWWRVVLRDGDIVGAVHAGPPGSANPLWSLVQNEVKSDGYVDILREGNLEALATA